MRIGIDCRLWNETGVGRYTRNLVRELAIIDKHNEYTLFVLPKDEEQVSQMANGKWQIVSTDIRWHTLEEQLRFPEVLLKENLDLVHFPYFSVPILYPRPFVVTIHDLIIHHFPTGKSSTLPYPLYWLKLQGYKYVILQAAKRSKKVIAVSNSTKKEIVDHLKVPTQKVTVTYEGVDEAIKDFNSQNTRIPAQGKYFLYVGNAYPHKNLNNLLEAFRIISKADKDISLVLAGKNDFFYQRLKAEIAEKDKVIFFEARGDDELAALYHNAIALVMPSLMEGFGLTPLEAMANDCVVLASDIPSLREICNNAAIYFDPQDVESIATAMQSVLEKNDAKFLTDLRKTGIRHAASFSWSKMARETLAVYESCFSG
ncbi:MAG: glycosyltransferase family 1 protein [bacterium]|nr:glycosyltransferase family 1 protein [bacterium]